MNINEETTNIEDLFAPGEKEVLNAFVEKQVAGAEGLQEVLKLIKSKSNDSLEHIVCEGAFEIKHNALQAGVPKITYMKFLWIGDQIAKKVDTNGFTGLQILAFKIATVSLLQKDFVKFSKSSRSNPEYVAEILSKVLENEEVKESMSQTIRETGIPEEVLLDIMAAVASGGPQGRRNATGRY